MNNCRTCSYYSPINEPQSIGKCMFTCVTEGTIYNAKWVHIRANRDEPIYPLKVYNMYGCVHWRSAPLEKEVMIGQHKWRIILDPVLVENDMEFRNEDGKSAARIVKISSRCVNRNMEDIPY